MDTELAIAGRQHIANRLRPKLDAVCVLGTGEGPARPAGLAKVSRRNQSAIIEEEVVVTSAASQPRWIVLPSVVDMALGAILLVPKQHRKGDVGVVREARIGS